MHTSLCKLSSQFEQIINVSNKNQIVVHTLRNGLNEMHTGFNGYDSRMFCTECARPRKSVEFLNFTQLDLPFVCVCVCELFRICNFAIYRFVQFLCIFIRFIRFDLICIAFVRFSECCL